MRDTRRAILVPLDGSELAERALEPARRLAIATAATMLLVHVVPEHAHDRRDGFASEIEEAQRYLSGVAGRVRASADLENHAPVILTQACVGAPADRIVREAELWHADEIVMSTHGRGGLGRLVHGSVADAVLRHSSVPVLLVPARADRPQFQGDAIVLPLDGSPFAETALPRAAELARELACPVLLVRAVPGRAAPVEESSESSALVDESVVNARRYLDGVLGQLRRAGIEARCEVIIGPAASAILGCADGCDAAAIVMTTHGRSGLSRMVFGSVTGAVLEQTSHPLLLVHAVAGNHQLPRRSMHAVVVDPEPEPLSSGLVDLQ